MSRSATKPSASPAVAIARGVGPRRYGPVDRGLSRVRHVLARRPVRPEDALQRARGLLGTVLNVVSSFVDLLAEPVAPGELVAFHITELLPGRLAADAGRGGVADGPVGPDHADPARRSVMCIGVLLACPPAWSATTIRPPGRGGPARVTPMAACLYPFVLTAGRALRHRAPPIRYRPFIGPNGPGACLPADFLPAPRFGELPILVLPRTRRGILCGPRPGVSAALTG